MAKKPAAPKPKATPKPKAADAAPAPLPDDAVDYIPIKWAEYGQILNDRFRQARKAFVYSTDMKTFGVVDHWGVPVENAKGKIYDDCDGFAFYCFSKLQSVIPNLQFHASPVICQVETGEWHMVLAIYTDEGVKCMDNRQDGILDLTALIRAGYHTFHRPRYGYPLDAKWQSFSASL